MQKCSMCLKEAQLMQSHLIPKFAYKAVQDGKKRSLPIGEYSNEAATFVQSGIRTPLLCHECEEILSSYEGELKKFIDEIQDGSTRVQEDPEGEILLTRNFDFDKIKKAVLSIIWRLDVIRNLSEAERNKIKLGRYFLGDKNCEEIRKIILDCSPVPVNSYPITMDKITIDGKKRADMIFTFPSGKHKPSNTYTQSICLGGIYFTIYMKKDIGNFLGENYEICVLGGPNNPLILKDINEIPISPALLNNLNSEKNQNKIQQMKSNP